MKKILYICCFVIGSMIITGCTNEEMKLKQDSYTIEYGKNIDNDVKTYLDNSDDFIKETKLSGIPDNEKEKQYPAIGEYELTLKNNGQENKIKVIVKDTVAPKLKDIKEQYEVEYGKKLDIKNIKADDLAKVTITLDDSKVNYKKAGTYDATVIAQDSSDNEAKQNIKIKVKEEEKIETTKSSTKSNSNTSKTSKKSSSSSKKSSSSSVKNDSSSNSSSSNSDKSSGSASSNSSSSNKNTSEISTNVTYYACLQCDFKTTSYEEMMKHLDESPYCASYGINYEDFEWPSDWE